MSGIHYEISPEVFARYPGYVRGVVLAHGVSNGTSPDPLLALLRAAEEGVRQRVDANGVAEHPRIRSWREAYRAFGAKPGEYRSSIEAMVRRAVRGDPLPAINAIVDIGNIISLQYLVPAGAHAIDGLSQDIALRPATGREDFVALGSDTLEHPNAGEIIFAEGDCVLTRRWTWRQGTHTLTLPGSRAIEFNVDGLPPVTAEEVEEMCRAAEELILRFCGGRLRHETLSAGSPRMSLGEEPD